MTDTPVTDREIAEQLAERIVDFALERDVTCELVNDRSEAIREAAVDIHKALAQRAAEARRAAILAMREPTSAQIRRLDAIRSDPKRLIDGATCWDACRLYSEMIDAALSEDR